MHTERLESFSRFLGEKKTAFQLQAADESQAAPAHGLLSLQSSVLSPFLNALTSSGWVSRTGNRNGIRRKIHHVHISRLPAVMECQSRAELGGGADG